MKNSIQDLKSQLSKGEKLSVENLVNVKGGCGTLTDPRRCAEDLLLKIVTYFKK